MDRPMNLLGLCELSSVFVLGLGIGVEGVVIYIQDLWIFLSYLTLLAARQPHARRRKVASKTMKCREAQV